MLILSIAAGVILALVVLRFWRQALRAGVWLALAAIALFVILALAIAPREFWEEIALFAVMIGGFYGTIFVILKALRAGGPVWPQRPKPRRPEQLPR